ncbi:MAG TPA: DUF1598 domain-containing protein [Pirellulales bacterium]|nr:DUF1598 domain-containing protein [Pirellulales bacterium]
MRWVRARFVVGLLVATLGLFAVASNRSFGQGGGGGGANAATLNINTNSTGNAQQGAAGVAIDKGVLRTYFTVDPSGEQTRQRIEASKVSLNPEVQKKSKLRKISLQRLEQAIAKQLASDRRPTDEMRYLAGMSRIQNIFFYPDTGDIVIAGPAEGWYSDLAGRMVSMSSGRAVIELQDLVTALRAYPPGAGGGPRMIGCSIDATTEGLQAMQDFVKTLPQVADASMATDEYAQYIVNGLRTSLGLQKVRIDGVPPKTHFAQVMVEADYRMKLIGLGMEQPPVQVKIRSYVDLADSAAVARNAMQRWWFVPDYKCIKVSEDELAMEIVGYGVKLLSEDEMVATDGTRHKANTSAGGNRASQAFVSGFTTKYPELAARSHVYGQLRNLIDLTVAAVFIQKHDYYGRADWKMPVLGDESKLPVEVYDQPVEVETAVTHRWKKSGGLMTPVGGGVTMHPEQAMAADNLLKDDGKTAKTREAINLDALAEGQWWWD